MTPNLQEAFVKIKQGYLQGINTDGVAVFKGIPYAKPPVGDNRWKPPQEPDRWTLVRSACEFGGESFQVSETSIVNGIDDTISELYSPHHAEDCLYLNIWSPASSTDERLPVYFWIHGGAYADGAGSQSLYNAHELSRRGKIVVVTINYRLGIFGFLVHPELTAESKYQSSGNYGLMDQLAALRWVVENISAFGGDSDNITIGGQSAGAGSVGALIASPLAAGLFKRATIQSGPIFGRMLAMSNLSYSERIGTEIMEGLGAKELAELRCMDAVELHNKFVALNKSLSPIVDGYILTDTPANTVLANKHNKVDVLCGSNSDEFGTNPAGIAPNKFENYVRKCYGKYADQVLGIYQYTSHLEAAQSYVHLISDNIFYGTIQLAEKYVEFCENQIYVYYYDRPIKHEKSEYYGAPHSAELPYLFYRENKGGIWPWDSCVWDESDYEFADELIRRWSGFISNGIPGGGWEAYTDNRMIMEFGQGRISPLPKEPLAERLKLFYDMQTDGFSPPIDLNLTL